MKETLIALMKYYSFSPTLVHSAFCHDMGLTDGINNNNDNIVTFIELLDL